MPSCHRDYGLLDAGYSGGAVAPLGSTLLDGMETVETPTLMAEELDHSLATKAKPCTGLNAKGSHCHGTMWRVRVEIPGQPIQQYQCDTCGRLDPTYDLQDEA
mgnify:CR=1 FL=1